MNKEEIRQFKSLLKQGSLRHMNIILDEKFQKSLLEIIKDYEKKDQQITQLTNNWNELRKFIESERFDKQYAFDEYYLPIIDKMKEIKERKNENI